MRRKHPGSHMCDISLSVLLMANSGPDSQERVPADSRETTRSLLLTSHRPTVSPPQSATRHPLALPKLKSSLAPSCHYRSRVDAGKPFAFFCQPVHPPPPSLLIVTSKESRTRSSNAHLSALRLMYSLAPLISAIRCLVKCQGRENGKKALLPLSTYL